MSARQRRLRLSNFQILTRGEFRAIQSSGHNKNCARFFIGALADLVAVVGVAGAGMGLSGCASVWKSEATVRGEVGTAEGQWRGKALVRNFRTKKSGTIDIDIIAREPSRLRMELTGSFGVHIASVAMNDQGVTYILTQEKKFISAVKGENALAKLIPIHLPPSALLAVLFERPLPEAEWLCNLRKGSTALPDHCEHRGEHLSIEWLERTGLKRHLKISATDAELEMVLDEAKSKVEVSADVFALQPPNGYRRESL